MNYDLIVIGGGALGVFHAYHALQAGKRVLLLEKDNQANEATVRNFGQVVPSGQQLDPWFEYGRKALSIYKEIQAQYDISIRPNGTIYIASDPSEMAVLEEMHELFRERGYESVLMSKAACLEKWQALRSDYAVGGLFFPQEVSAEPPLLIHRVTAFLQTFEHFTFRNNTLVIGCEVKDGGVEVRDSLGNRFSADKAIVCSGREFRSLFYDIYKASGMRLVKLNMMLSQPMPEVSLPGNILTGLTIRRYDSFKSAKAYQELTPRPEQAELVKWGIHVLFKQAIDGSIIIGDTHEYTDVENSEALDFRVSEHLNRLMLDEGKRILNLPSWEMQSYWLGYYVQEDTRGIFEYNIENKIFIVNGIGGKGMSTGAGLSAESIANILTR